MNIYIWDRYKRIWGTHTICCLAGRQLFETFTQPNANVTAVSHDHYCSVNETQGNSPPPQCILHHTSSRSSGDAIYFTYSGVLYIVINLVETSKYITSHCDWSLSIDFETGEISDFIVSFMGHLAGGGDSGAGSIHLFLHASWLLEMLKGKFNLVNILSRWQTAQDLQ